MKPRIMIRLSNRFLIVAVLIILIAGSQVAIIPARAQGDKIVYVAICVDSETTGGFPGMGSADPHPTLDVREYSRTSPSTVADVFNNDFRNSHRDSFGNIFKMSWFAQMDYIMAQSNYVWADGSSAGVSGYTAIRDLLVNNWGTEIQTYGDSIEYHHHFVIYDGTWQLYNNGPDAGYPGYEMYALDHMIIDRNFYPSTWRSGDWIMPPALSSWLEQWMPFDYTPLTGMWYPVHPSGMDRWQTTCPYTPYSQSNVNSAFAYARDNGSAVYSFCTHDKEDMKLQVATLQSYLDAADADEATYPNVSFKYVSAREAMQLALGFTEFAPPTFTVTPSGGTYTIVSSEPLWKNHPYIALKYINGTYSHMNATPTGINTWTITPPSAWELDTVGVGASDLYGNPGVATVTVTLDQYTLTVGTVGSGSVTKSPDQATYASGTPVQLTAVPAASWRFSAWSGSLTGSANPASLTMTGNMSVTATFIQNAYSLTVSTVGSGSVAKVPDQASYHLGDVVQLTATPAAGWSFSSWSGSLTGSANPASLTVTGDMSVTATFIQLTAYGTFGNKEGASYTQVRSLLNEIHGSHFVCPTSGTLQSISIYIYAIAGSTVKCAIYTRDSALSGTLVAVSEQRTFSTESRNYHWETFATTAPLVAGQDYWLLATATGSNVYIRLVSVYVDPSVPVGKGLGWATTSFPSSFTAPYNWANLYSIYATYATSACALTVGTVGSGSVTKSPDQAMYASGTVVTLTATAAPSWSFSGWSGDVASSVNPVQVTMDGAKSVTATFTQHTYTVGVTVNPSSAAGTVTGYVTTPTYHYGDVVTLTESPNNGYTFSSWGGDGSGSATTCQITITKNMSVTATFIQNGYTLTVSTVGSGSVAKSPDQASYYLGDVVQLTATPAAGWSFSSWSGSLTGSANPASLTITGNMLVTATFTLNTYTLTVGTIGSGNVNPNNAGPYHYGDTVQLTAVPATGWSFSGWNGDATGSLNPVSVIINGTTSVTATFTQNTYRITVTQGANGVISPETIDVEYGSEKAFTITPDNGYHIFDVVADAIPQGAVSSYLFRNVVANHTISASFAIEVYTPFSIVSNSTISELAFNSTSQVLSFTAGGPSGTTGFSNVTISKTLIADVSGLEVYLDGTKTSYVVSDLTTSWLIYITYQHSTHKIAINFAPPPSARADYVPYIALAAILGFIGAFVLTVFARRRGKSSQSEARARS